MDLGITIRKKGQLCRYGGRGQLLKAGGPDEDLEDGREGRISWAGHLSGASSCRKCVWGQMGKLACGGTRFTRVNTHAGTCRLSFGWAQLGHDGESLKCQAEG